MIQKLKSWLLDSLGIDPPEDSMTLPNSDQSPVTQEWEILLIGAESDELTGILCHYLDELDLPSEFSSRRLIGTIVAREEVVLLLDSIKGKKRIKIFCGHGSETALLGLPKTDTPLVRIDGRDFSSIYDEDLIGIDQSALFALCCNAGQSLGSKFISITGRTFMGYSGRIGFDLSDEQCRRVWKKIIQTICTEIAKDGYIGVHHEATLRQLYDDAIDYFRNGEGKDNDRAIGTILNLMQHKKRLLRLESGV